MCRCTCSSSRRWAEPPQYAHIAPLMKQIPGGKRKLSKRKDAEAGVDFYVEQGYPAAAVLYYLRGLANGRLAELPLGRGARRADPARRVRRRRPAGRPRQARGHQRRPHRHAAPASRSWPPSAPGRELTTPRWRGRWTTEPDLAVRAVSVERVGVENPRKDLRKWSDFRAAYGFFFPQLFEPVTTPPTNGSRGWASTPDVVRRFLAEFADGYRRSTTATPGSARSASSPRGRGSRRRPRSSRRTPTPTRGRSARRPRSCGSR